MLSSLRVLIAEDHLLVREALARLLSEHCTVVGTVERGDHVLPAVEELRPNAVVLDVSMPGKGGFHILPELRAAHPRLAIIMVTNHDSEPYRRAALERGADGFVAKQNASRELFEALKAGQLSRSRVGHQGLTRAL